jgi:D-tyrosyl-tRNA(Tyr) deacylase
MRAVVQRVKRAEVRVAGQCVAAIDRGLLVLVGVLAEDGAADAQNLAQQIAHLRCFADGAGRMGRSILEVGAAALVVSEITLAADGTKGRRPSLDRAAPSDRARSLVALLAETITALGIPTATGRFGADMEIELVNEGPVTLVFWGPSAGRSPGPEPSQVLS